MKLLRLHLDGFGTFHRGLEVKFAKDKLNLIMGRNEAGKSTLLSGLVGVLFGFRDLNLVRKFESWDEHDAYCGEVELESDDGRHLRFTRDFAIGRATITEIAPAGDRVIFQGSADPRGAGVDDRQYFEELGKVLGFEDEATFRGTVFVGQQSLETSISDQVRRLISGPGASDYKGALHELHRRYAELTQENPWKPKAQGPKRALEDAKSRLTERETRLREGRKALAKSADLEAEIRDLQARLSEDRAEQAALEQELAHQNQRLELLGKEPEVERRYQDALARRDQSQRLLDKAQDLERRLNQDYARFAKAPDDFADLLRIRSGAAADRIREAEALESANEELNQLRPIPNHKLGAIAGLAAAAAGAGVGFALGLNPTASLILALVSGVLGWAIGRLCATGYKQTRASLMQRMAALESAIAGHERRVQEATQKAGPALAGKSTEQAQTEWKEFSALREERKRLLTAVKATGDRASLAAEFDAAARERSRLHEAIAALELDAPHLAKITDRAALQKSIRQTEAKTAELQERAQAASESEGVKRLELASLSGRMDFDVAELSESVREESERLSRLEIERRALRESIDTLDACLRDFQETDALRLSTEVSGLFGKITGDKYSRVSFSGSMEPVVSRGDSLPIAPQDLSQGARDQLYFAMRVGMARYLSRHARLPLFLDDPFVNFDAERLAATQEVLGKLDGHQVILVTCNRDYSGWSEAKIDLDASAARHTD